MNVQKREYQKAYLDYWQSTCTETGTGRPVDGVLCAVSPYAAVIPGKYRHVGYTNFVNVLDYTCVTIPVTTADRKVDEKRPVGRYLSEKDEQVQLECK